jgi:ribosome-associated heat shock protein Hsp15
MSSESQRADKWLHHVRVFKTRSLATQACQKSNVTLEGRALKPSRELRAGDVVEVVRGDLRLRLRVLAFPPQRIGAPLVEEFCENLTPEEWIRKAAELRAARQHLDHIRQHPPAAVAQLVAAAKEHLAAGGAEQLGETCIHRDAEKAARVAAVRDSEFFQDGAKGNAALDDHGARLLGQQVKMNADGAELDRRPSLRRVSTEARTR